MFQNQFIINDLDFVVAILICCSLTDFALSACGYIVRTTLLEDIKMSLKDLVQKGQG